MWKVHLRAGAGGGENERWFQIQDLIVEEIRKEMIVLGETILQVRPRPPRAAPVRSRPWLISRVSVQIWERRPEAASPTSGMDVDKP